MPVAHARVFGSPTTGPASVNWRTKINLAEKGLIVKRIAKIFREFGTFSRRFGLKGPQFSRSVRNYVVLFMFSAFSRRLGRGSWCPNASWIGTKAAAADDGDDFPAFSGLVFPVRGVAVAR